MQRVFKEILHHGTIAEIRKVDVTQGRGRKDFSRGFYMAATKNQAVGMTNKKFREAVRRSIGKKETNFTRRLYQVRIDLDYAATLNVKVFETANEEWLDFVLMCRSKGGVPHSFDLVIGPTADDDAILSMKAYLSGLYGRVGSGVAKEVLLNNLETGNLGVQYYIGKQEVADRLIREIVEIESRFQYDGRQDQNG